MPVSLEVSEGVAVLTLDRPDVLNAFDDEMGFAALDAVKQVVKDHDARCLVITGAGRAFSAGEDLGALSDGYARGEVPDLGNTLVERYNPLIREVRALRKPVVAAVNGVAAGAGASLALACDFRIASEKAKLVIAFIKVGLVPDSGAVWFLSRMVGSSRAMQLAATAEPLGAEEALRLGVFSKVVPVEDFEATWRAFAIEMARSAPEGFALTKELVERAATASLDEQLQAEVDAQTKAGRTEDHLEGVRAFLEKRPPHFKGS